MTSDTIAALLKTPEGLETITRLLEALHYDPTMSSGGFFFKIHPYTVKLRAFVQQVHSAIPEAPHPKNSDTYLDGLADDSRNDLGGFVLEELRYMADKLEADKKRAQALAKLKDLCERLLTDPDP